jgi:hypothetical protein
MVRAALGAAILAPVKESAIAVGPNRSAKLTGSFRKAVSTELGAPMIASPEILLCVWTERFERWFAAPGTALMNGKVNSAFLF